MKVNSILRYRQTRLEKELWNKAELIRKTRNAGREIYTFTANDSPRLMRIIGRLREISFREAGGGTGWLKDIDEYDTHSTNPYTQLIVWDPKDKQIVGGYRIINWSDAPKDEEGNPDVSTRHYFDVSDKFMEEYGPDIMELGRSFVTPAYQARNRKSIYSLDNLWDGLGKWYNNNPEKKHFFGKKTLYKNRNAQSKDIIYAWLTRRFPDEDNLIVPKADIAVEDKDFVTLDEILKNANTTTVQQEIQAINKHIAQFGEEIPQLFSSYAKVSPTMKVYGTAENNDFGPVEETLFSICVKEIEPKKLKTYMNM